MNSVLPKALLLAHVSVSLAAYHHDLTKTPPMGWDSYNHYSCFPNQSIIETNAKALVDLGLAKLGYEYVIPDRGWGTAERSSNGTLQWNSTLFPAGYPALIEYVHKLGLKFGIYGDGGIKTCSEGQVLSGSLGHEPQDAETFASWGVDMLKYDNCYSDAALGFPDASYAPSELPNPRFKNMSTALLATGRPILYAICEWGVSFPSNWAGSMGNTWRITNDIIPEWSTVYRQINQFVPNAQFAGPHRWPDLDMLEVGNNVMTVPEEQSHMTLWSIAKSPLIIGARLAPGNGRISTASLAILSNKEVLSLNQDSLGMPANLTRRYTNKNYDIWAGPLSAGRTVAALVNWNDTERKMTMNFADFGIQRAGSLRDIWNKKTMTNVQTSYSATVPAHGTLLVVLSDTATAGTYSAKHFAKKTGAANLTFKNIYGITNSPSYELTIHFEKSVPHPRTMFVHSSPANNTRTVHVPAHRKSVTTRVALTASGANTLSFTEGMLISSIKVSNPEGTFYGAPDFTVSGSAVHVTCAPGTCLPVGSKVGYLEPQGAATISISPQSGSKSSTLSSQRYVELTYINNDIAFASAFTTGRNARNITVAVNGGNPTRLEVPLSGFTSELFSPGYGWYDSATLGVLVDGFGNGDGNDTVVVSNVNGDQGVQSYGADFVGLRVY